METLILNLQSELYQQLQLRASKRGKSPEELAAEWVAKRLNPKSVSERERAREILRSAGLLVEPSQQMRKLASEVTMTLAEVQTKLDKAGGKPLSEIVIEQRGLKG